MSHRIINKPLAVLLLFNGIRECSMLAGNWNIRECLSQVYKRDRKKDSQSVESIKPVKE